MDYTNIVNMNDKNISIDYMATSFMWKKSTEKLSYWIKKKIKDYFTLGISNKAIKYNNKKIS